MAFDAEGGVDSSIGAGCESGIPKERGLALWQDERQRAFNQPIDSGREFSKERGPKTNLQERIGESSAYQ